MRLSERLWAALLLRCPNCRQGRLFESWFRMREYCPSCGLAFYRESGYYVGSIYINYGATVAAVIAAVLLFRRIPERFELVFFLFVALLSSLAFFRHSRSLWLAIDYWVSPWEPGERTANPLSASRRRR